MKTYNFLKTLFNVYMILLLIGFIIFFSLTIIELVFFDTDKELENPILYFLMYSFFYTLPVVIFSIIISYIYYEINPCYSVEKVENLWYAKVNSSYLRGYHYGIKTIDEIFLADTFPTKEGAERFLQEYINKKINPPIEQHEYKNK